METKINQTNQKETSLIDTLLFYALTPIPATILVFLFATTLQDTLAGGILSTIKNAKNDSVYYVFLSLGGDKAMENFNTWTMSIASSYAGITFLAVLSSVLLIPTKQKNELKDTASKLYCAIRANCVGLVVMFFGILVMYLDPLGELKKMFTESVRIPLTWTGIAACIGAFLLAQKLFLNIKTDSSLQNQTAQRGMEMSLDQEKGFYGDSNQLEESQTARDSFEKQLRAKLEAISAKQIAEAEKAGSLTPDAKERMKELTEDLVKAGMEGLDTGVEKAHNELIKKTNSEEIEKDLSKDNSDKGEGFF